MIEAVIGCITMLEPFFNRSSKLALTVRSKSAPRGPRRAHGIPPALPCVDEPTTSHAVTKTPVGITTLGWREVATRTWRAASSQHSSLDAAGLAFLAYGRCFPLAALVMGGLLFGRFEVLDLLSRVRMALPESYATIVGQLQAIAAASRVASGATLLRSRRRAVEFDASHAWADRSARLQRRGEANVLASLGAEHLYSRVAAGLFFWWCSR